MRLRRPARTALAGLTAATLAATGFAVSATAAPPSDPVADSQDFRAAVTPEAIGQHLDALQAIADANGGTRASGTEGYDASRDYVLQRLVAAGYDPTVQTFDFPYFSEDQPSELAELTPEAQTFQDPDDFAVMSYSGSGDVSGPVIAVDTTFAATESSTSGCEASDFTGFSQTDPDIALIQRGTCTFEQKAANAQDAGADAVLIFNRGTDGATDTVQGTLGRPFDIPVLGLSFAAGQDLGDPASTTARVFTETTNSTKTTYNVIADTPGGDRNNVVMAGAHLDSVEEGPGINDNGSGSATILAVAEQLAKVDNLTNKVRFAWWGAEESGLLGAEHYVADLQQNNPDELKKRLALYLNFDMIASPNFVRFVYDGDNSTGEGVDGPKGSAQIERLFTDYFDSLGLASEPTAFDGRSDYGPFLTAGVPSGGLFTGAEGVKTEEEAATYGGTAGEWYDPCYHQACDDRSNISPEALDQMSDAVAHAVYTYSQSTGSLNGKKVRAHGQPSQNKGHSALR